MRRISSLAPLAPLFILVAMGALVACDDDSDEVSHETASQAILARAATLSERAERTVRAMEETELGAQLGSGDALCAVRLEPDGEVIEECDEEIEEGSAADAIAKVRADLLKQLERHVFTRANIESQGDSEIVYLVRGSAVCAEVDPSDRADCTSTIDAHQIRVRVSYDGGADVYDLGVLAGAPRHELARIALGEESFGVRLDLAALKAGIAEFDPESGAQFPATFEGIAGLRVALDSDAAMTMSAEVIEAIRILDADSDLDVSIARAVPAASFTVDDAAKSVSASLSFGAIALSAIQSTIVFEGDELELIDEEDFDVVEEDLVERTTRIELGRLAGSFTANLESERLEVRGLELGTSDKPAAISIDGRRVVSALIATASGGGVDFDLSSRGEEGTTLTSPTGASIVFELAFGDLADEEGVGADSWMRADTLSIALDAASTLWFGDKGVRVEAGSLSIGSSAADTTLVAAAGQCVLDPQEDEFPQACDDQECAGGDVADGPELHPILETRVEACASPN